MKRYIYKLKKGFFTGFGIALGIGTAALLSISVGQINTFSSGTPLSSAKVNENFANLKTTVEGIYSVEPGTILPFGSETPPAGYLLCKGQAVSRTTYSALYAVIKDNFGSGDGSTTFNVPDFRGRFLRGWDDGAGRDPDIGSRLSMNSGGNAAGGLGSVQDENVGSHTHPITIGNFATAGLGFQAGSNSSPWEARGASSSFTTQIPNAPSGSETRPKNAYVNFIIKY